MVHFYFIKPKRWWDWPLELNIQSKRLDSLRDWKQFLKKLNVTGSAEAIELAERHEEGKTQISKKAPPPLIPQSEVAPLKFSEER